MTTIALHVLTTEIPEQWQHLPSRDVRHFDWAGIANDTSECEGCGALPRTHLWRVRSADGAVLDCGITVDQPT